jgi:hypothetical protein
MHPKYGDYMGPMDIFIAPNQKSLMAVPITPSEQIAQDRAIKNQVPLKVQFPDHLFVPDGAESLDIRRVANVTDGTVNAEFMSFTAPQGAKVHFIAYSVYSDGQTAANQEFIPRVDGRRVFAYHGDPNNNFKIDLGLGPDLSNANLITCQLTLNPKEKLTWSLTNNQGVAIAMGVRMVGYLDYTQTRVNARAGG